MDVRGVGGADGDGNAAPPDVIVVGPKRSVNKALSSPLPVRCVSEAWVTPCIISWPTMSSGVIGTPADVRPYTNMPRPSAPKGGAMKKALFTSPV